MEKSELFQELPKCDRNTMWAHTVGKMVPTDLWDTGLLQTFNLSKIQHLQSSIKHNKPGMPVN